MLLIQQTSLIYWQGKVTGTRDKSNYTQGNAAPKGTLCCFPYLNVDIRRKKLTVGQKKIGNGLSTQGSTVALSPFSRTDSALRTCREIHHMSSIGN